jgi:hypothetical protein
MEEGGISPSKGVWERIKSSLSDSAIIQLRSSKEKYRWIAVAAIFVAVFSFALNLNVSEKAYSSVSYNALLPTENDHFRFFERNHVPNAPIAKQGWKSILFLKENASEIVENEPLIAENSTLNTTKTIYLKKRTPQISDAQVLDTYVSPYFVAEARNDLNYKKESNSSNTFWAGVEAGAGSFNPSFNGSDPITANVNFDALANNLGQSGFVNPSSSASQSDMNEGIATTLGVDFGIKMGKKWTIETGVQYTSIQNQSNASLNVVDVYVINSSPIIGEGSKPVSAPARIMEVEENFDHSINLDNKMTFTSIPLKAGYYLVDKRVSLRVNAGLSANYFLESSLSDPSGQIENAIQTSDYNEWSFDGLTGFEVGYSIFENFNLTLEPNYRRSITPLSQNLNNRSGFMVQTGFRYIIK